MHSKYEWHKIAEHESELTVQANEIAVVEVRNKKICITKFRDQWFGFPYACPHAGGILANGHVDSAGNIVCPLHRYKFSLENGRNTSGEGFYLKRYPVERRIDGMYVGLEKGGLFGIFAS